MSGYRDGHMAVEFYKGDWILRAALSQDRPIDESADAKRAMDAWKARNRAKLEGHAA